MRVRVKVKEHFKVLDFQFRYFFSGFCCFEISRFEICFSGFFISSFIFSGFLQQFVFSS